MGTLETSVPPCLFYIQGEKKLSPGLSKIEGVSVFCHLWPHLHISKMLRPDTPVSNS